MSKNEPVSKEDVVVSSDDESALFDTSDFNQTYIRKSMLITSAIDEMGFGRYQLGLFFVAGFGWFADNAWPTATSYILQRLVEKDKVHYPVGRAPYLTLAQNLGLLAGALFWSLSADIVGRRWAFNLTFLFTGIFSLAAGGSPTFVAIGVFCALWSFGVGGNLPVDSAIFLESLPTNSKWLLTVMSVWWSLGQVVTALISWALITNYSCSDTASECLSKDNKGWRYFLFTLGGLTLLMFSARFLFPLYESPTFYLARGNDEKALETLNHISRINKKPHSLTIEELRAIDDLNLDNEHPEASGGNQLLQSRLKRYNLSHIRQCFGSRRLAISLILVISSWALIGLAFPLYNAFLPSYLEQRGSANKALSVSTTYRNTLIVAVLGVPGSIIAGVLVELRIGRKGTLFVSLLMTGIVLFGSTTAKTSNSYLAWNCFFNFFSTIMYGVLYAYTPEVFPTKIRGTAVGLAASANRVLGVFAPIIAIFADLTTSAPIFVSGALFLVSAVLVVFYPYEPRNKSSL
ncbi:CIC11C00000002613 [Sungouiella intermedia]|uniref:CIC11C00000002613 n=1 Tax=Sungouiella intermedia TaxID=45354 RepID=A0A1L0DID3_9ASCO|nr:CIC11C00000002613 [[Candida] intermedia]